jgi:uncharacterized BrkB/YihY/UPF0761 family membrane protein
MAYSCFISSNSPHSKIGAHSADPGLATAIKQVLKQTWTEIRADEVFGRAAQLAYYFFLALFPFLICVIATLQTE